jgi:LacI family transcriptional regulator
VATVDRVLNARAPVNPATAKQVFLAAEQVGYFAARLIGQRIHASRPSYRFGILLLGTAQAFYANLAQSIVSAAEQYAGAHLSCQFDYIVDRTPSAIISQIEKLAVQCDGLAVVSFAHPLINAAIAQIREAGVPIVALLSDIDEQGSEPYVGQDNHVAGRTMGWLLARLCDVRKGSIAILLGGHRFLGHQARVEGLKGYLAEHAPGLKPLEPLINLDNCDITEEATLDLLARHSDLRGLCVVGGGGEGIISALAQLPKRPALICILQESTELSRKALAQGFIDVVMDSQPPLTAVALVNLLVVLQTSTVFDPEKHRIHIPLNIVTPENAQH